MLHNFEITGICFRLRPVTVADAVFIDKMRQNPDLNQFLNESPRGTRAQKAWIRNYLEQSGDYYFVVEEQSSKTPCGLIAIYDFNEDSRTGEWGRWMIVPGTFAAVESAMLLFRFCFVQLDIKLLYCRTVVDNSQVVSFHDSVGLKRAKVLPKYLEKGNNTFDAIEHTLIREDWVKIDPKLQRAAQRVCAMKVR